MTIIEKWQKKIEKNAFQSTLKYVDRNGVEHTEEVFFKRSLLPLGDWGRIYPPIKPNGKINYINLWFGGWKNLIKLLGILAVVVMALLYINDLHNVIEACKAADLLKISIN